MNNPTSLTREQNLHNWSQIISECQEAKARGTKVRDWLETRGISHDTYYYWYAEVRKELINSAGSIVPIPETDPNFTESGDKVFMTIDELCASNKNVKESPVEQQPDKSKEMEN